MDSHSVHTVSVRFQTVVEELSDDELIKAVYEFSQACNEAADFMMDVKETAKTGRRALCSLYRALKSFNRWQRKGAEDAKRPQ